MIAAARHHCFSAAGGLQCLGYSLQRFAMAQLIFVAPSQGKTANGAAHMQSDDVQPRLVPFADKGIVIAHHVEMGDSPLENSYI